MRKNIAGQELLDADEMCSMLGLTRPSLRKLVARNFLPAPVQLGRKKYWFQESVESAFASARDVTARNVKKSAIARSLPSAVQGGKPS